MPLYGSPYALTPTVLCPAELDKGQMLHADSFHLGDSMSALEMMDPKMDAGVINAKNATVIPAGACPRGSLFACVRPRTCPAMLTVAVLLGSGPQTSASIAGWWIWTRMYRRL